MTVSPHLDRSLKGRLARRVGSSALVTLSILVPLACSSSDDSNPTRSTEAAVTTAPGDGTVVGPTTTGVPATAPDTAPVADIVKEPVAPGTPAPLGAGVSVVLVDSEDLDVEARVPGETAGPAVAATIEVRNDSSEPFDLSSLAVTATYEDGTPAIGNDSEPARALTGTVKAGGSAKGVYVFRTPPKAADTVIVEVQSAERPNVVRFRVV